MTRCSFTTLLVILTINCFAEEIEEAVPWESEQIIKAQEKPADSKLKHRAYFLFESTELIRDFKPWDATEINQSELNFSGVYTLNQSFKVFTDMSGTYIAPKIHDQFLVNQLGARISKGHWSTTLGRERSRKSPGLVFSPSEFLYGRENLPGMREQRQGVWQVRSTYQSLKHAFDLYYLPNMVVDEHGLPDTSIQKDGAALGSFHQFSGIDLALQYVYVDRHAIGGFIQGFVKKSTKLYFETAREELPADVVKTSSLLGVSYEAMSNLVPRFELYYQDGGLSAAPTPANISTSQQVILNFLNQRAYFLSSLMVSDLWRESSVTLNFIGILSKSPFLATGRWQVPLGKHQSLALTVMYLKNIANFDEIIAPLVEWKYVF